MKSILTEEKVLRECHIYRMLSAQTRPHISFHTPGHKKAGFDITELSYSDNLSCPNGCILQAEKDIARIVGAGKSFILTDGSTCGVLSMLYAAKAAGVKKVLASQNTHKSFYNGCALLRLTPLLFTDEREFLSLVEEADCLFVTSPDYYGQIPPLAELRKLCDETGKVLLVDGAHGGHLHFHKEIYAGGYADMWVDGVHKSLPSFTQGAVVSAKKGKYAELLAKSVDIFRTTSPSYPIMASVEYAVKFPQNIQLENRAKAFIQTEKRLLPTKDWTKICALFGKYAFEVEKLLQGEGIFAEFCDGNILTFYLSPATDMEDFETLQKRLQELFLRYPYEEKIEKKEVERVPAPHLLSEEEQTEWVNLSKAEGEICANTCGLFPPCTPLIMAGERIEKEKIELLRKADNAFGLNEGKILIIKKKGRK